MVVKTFRGLLADGGQERIRLQTIKGKVGYRIVKLQIITKTPGAGSDYASCIQIFKHLQTTIDGVVDFSDSSLLGVAYMSGDSASITEVQETIIFDREMFNQDIYITHSELIGTQASNYYLELEVIPLDDAGAEYTTLKDMRQD